jgi:hypothetical protein
MQANVRLIHSSLVMLSASVTMCGNAVRFECTVVQEWKDACVQYKPDTKRSKVVNFTRRGMSPQLPPYGRFGAPSQPTCWGSNSGQPARCQQMYLKYIGAPNNEVIVKHVMTGVHNTIVVFW